MASIDRVACFVDWFNLYHALDELGAPELKWLDLRALLGRYAAQPNQKIVAVYYFSAFATWRPARYARHREYVKALQASGVTPVMGVFKSKRDMCRTCKATFVRHEEKETDVNIGLWVLNEAYKNSYDHAFIVSRDSDLTPVVKMLHAEFREKRVRIITPPGRRSSKELVAAAGGPRYVRTIKESRVRKALFPEKVKDASGTVAATRPSEWAPQT